MKPSVHVELSDLRIDAGQDELLRGLSLELHGGEYIGLVGESGSGKSLTSLALLNLLPRGLRASAGLRVDGQSIAFGSPAHDALRGRMFGLVPQDPLAALHPLRSVGAQLIETLRVARGMSRDIAGREAVELLRRVQLPDPEAALSRHPHLLSGGQRQRVAIALALATQPRVLIADEPTSALDARIARGILDLLDQLRREQDLAVLLISHDLPLVGVYAQRLLVLQHGTVVEHGGTQAVFASPSTTTRANCSPRIACGPCPRRQRNQRRCCCRPGTCACVIAAPATMRWRVSTSNCVAAKAWPWSVNPAAARARWAAPC